nr:MAG TPA: hypothetical protein [Caudoviricetes sp.]
MPAFAASFPASPLSVFKPSVIPRLSSDVSILIRPSYANYFHRPFVR